MVEAGPPAVAPPSTIRATASPSAAATSSAVDDAGEPDRLALVAVMSPDGVDAARARANGWLETRTATSARPALTPIANTPGRSGTTSVSGPGQNAAASRACAALHVTASRDAAAMSVAISGNASPPARPLTANTAATASSRVGSAARP
jgi:hypothetical protein